MIRITRRTGVVAAGITAGFAVLVLAMVGAWALISSVGPAPEAAREGESVSTLAVAPAPTTASGAEPEEEPDQGALPWRIERFGSRRVASAWGNFNRWKVAVHCPTGAMDEHAISLRPGDLAPWTYGDDVIRDLLVVMVWDGEDEAYPMPVLNTAQIEALEYAPLEVEPGMRLANVGMFNSRGSDVLIRMRSGLRLGISGRTQRGGEPVADMVSLLGVSEALNQMGC